MFSLKVLTLNCWGIPIPIICKDQKLRIQEIAKALSKSDYHIVLLQEIWWYDDFVHIQEMVAHNLPYSHYFHSGCIGSGICVFSQYPIHDVLYFDYRLNGYAHKILHGDWFAGKGVGLFKVIVNRLHINVYTTHIHAEYSDTNDEYFMHRLVQSFQLSQFIKQTSSNCDAIIVGGDCNMEAKSLSYKILTSNAMLLDAWYEKKNTVADTEAGTCDYLDNSYTTSSKKHQCPLGKRIDYLLFRSNSSTKMTVDHYERVFGKIPNHSVNFSDHAGVSVTFSMMSAPTVQACPARDNYVTSDYLQAMNSEIDKSVKKLSFHRKFWFFMAALCSMILYSVNAFAAQETWVALFMNTLSIALVVFVAFSVWNGLVTVSLEKKAFIATQTEARYLLVNKKQN
ncbi:putative neutral sphingomyelinase [Argonauta hians]